MADLVFTYNSEKRYHEEYEGFDEEYSSGSAKVVTNPVVSFLVSELEFFRYSWSERN